MVESIASLPVLALLAADPPTIPSGDYFSIAKIIVTLLLLIPWFYFAPWVQKDAKKITRFHAVWSGSMLLVGTIGLAVWILLPFYIVGLMIFVVLTTAAFGAYVVFRNSKVEPEFRVLTSEHIATLLSPKKGKKNQAVTKLQLYGDDGRIIAQPNPNEVSKDDMDAYNLTQEILYDMIWRRASQADLTPAGEQMRLRFVIDGVITEQEPLTNVEGTLIIQYLKELGGMNVDDRRRPQQGKVSVDLAGSQVDIILASAGTTGGQRMVFRVVQESLQTDIATLGMSEPVLKDVRKAAQQSHGLIIVAGRPGNGVTSTLYALMRDQDAFIKHIVALEPKVEIELENITQTAYGQADKLPEILAAASRREPDVITVDHCENAETAKLIAEIATSRLVLLGMPATDSFSALIKWLKLHGSTDEAIQNLHGVLCQVLLRKLCPACRQAYRPNPTLLAKANLPVDKISKFYQPPQEPLLDEKGNPYTCPSCQGSGYVGRTAAFEWLAITDELRKFITPDASLSKLKAICRKNGMLYLQEQALAKVIEGITSIQEVIRVSQSAKKSSSA